ncbi:MAG: HD family hydrolase [Desulfurococcales archaeon]|nr:HD family hydrolase [Desulfurococcales archaeon]
MEGKIIPLGRALRGVVSLARTGWMLRGVPPGEAETVASHSYAAAVIAFELAVEASKKGFRVDPYKAASLALVHDLAEGVIGDISRRAGIGEAKRRAEEEAFKALGVSEEAKKLFMEFEEGSTLESRVARIAELLATYWMSLIYTCRGYDVAEIGESSWREALELASRDGIVELIYSLRGKLSVECSGGLR